ncbi:NADA-like protein [Mya arenaria]|uniref:NADA-like protein n=1 Tax=Mya arenaria TaxID=6604 RepID=A0ABY7F7S8_MYAAR|nr:NADA-like protein [Mya arenaria]
MYKRLMDVYRVILWTVTIVLWVCPDGWAEDCRDGTKATPNLREVVIGTCELYQATHQQFFCPDRNCSDTWEAFSEAFRYQPPCEISEERYERAIGDKPVWCGSEDAPGFGSTCPPWEPSATCRQHAQRAFWIAASHRYAGSAVGQIHVMLNASITPIYSNDSYFSLFEVPYIRPGFVDKVTVLLVNENPQAGRQKNITFECEENRRDIVYTYCLDNPSGRICELLPTPTNTAPPPPWNKLIQTLCLLVTLIVCAMH